MQPHCLPALFKVRKRSISRRQKGERLVFSLQSLAESDLWKDARLLLTNSVYIQIDDGCPYPGDGILALSARTLHVMMTQSHVTGHRMSYAEAL